jgi:hypothetical protein
MGGELGGRAPIVVEYKLRQDAVAPPQDDHTTAVPIGVAEPGRDIFAMGERKEIKSQVLVFDVPDVADDEKQISTVEFEPTHATPEPASSGKEEDKVHVGDVNNSAGAGEPEHAEVFRKSRGCLTGLLTTRRPLLIRSRMSCILRPWTLNSLRSHKSYTSHFMITSPSHESVWCL